MKKTINAKLILEDGSEYKAKMFGYKYSVAGEIVFNTAMTGYPESLTDPSYKGQFLLATYPLMGNYGVPYNNKESDMFKYFESDKIHVSAFIVSEYSHDYSHWNASKSLSDWMEENKIPGLYGIDTREITKKLREHGSMLAKIIVDDNDVEWRDSNNDNLVAEVSVAERKVYGNGRYKVLLVDCGVKNNIIRCLLKRDVTVIRVPYDYDFSDEEYDGLFISNGPGDPKKNILTIQNVKNAFDDEKPIMGICLGIQIMALAAGANTYKLKYGHRSHNQPVILKDSNRCFISSQNHSYAIDTDSLPADWDVLFYNANDNTCEGIKHKTKKFFAVQFHPEASSGPTDTEYLFDDFIDMMS